MAWWAITSYLPGKEIPRLVRNTKIVVNTTLTQLNAIHTLGS
jgi:hypothetical protein